MDRIAETQEFKDLMATKKVFIIPAFVFFLVYYCLLPILVGYAPQFMSTKVIAEVNLAYPFALCLIVISPSVMAIDPPTVTGTARHLIQAKALFPLENPGISIPVGSIGAILGTLLSHEPSSEHKFDEFVVRSNTGLGAERGRQPASSHRRGEGDILCLPTVQFPRYRSLIPSTI